MNKDEKSLLDELSNSVDSKMNYNDIANEINFSKYEKKKSFGLLFSKRLLLTVSSFVLVSLLIIIIMVFPNNDHNGTNGPDNNKPNNILPGNQNNNIGGDDNKDNIGSGEGENEVKVNIYDGFIKNSFEISIGNGPICESLGPQPPQPIIDSYFNIESEESSGDYNDGNGNDELTKPSITIGSSSFEYIYEVEYKNTINLEYICVYIEKELAEKIYEENKEVCDATCASPLNNVNGSIVDWFYSNSYYNKDKVLWISYNDVNKIYSKINDYVCVGVYQIQERIILREIFSNTIVNITDNIYGSLFFSNNGDEYLTPVKYELTNYVTWYSSNEIITKTNKESLFKDYSEFECSINIKENTIKLRTLAVQDEEELSKEYSSLLKDYHKLSNIIIVENDYPEKELGDITYITYKYNELVELIQELAKRT